MNLGNEPMAETTALNKPILFPHLTPERQIWRIPSSFTRDTPAVQTMIEHIETGIPTGAYEYAQNQWDYNNDDKGEPEIWIWNSRGEKISFPAFLKMTEADAKQLYEGCQKIDFENQLIPRKGLEPSHLLRLKHAGAKGTLGMFGQGGKISAAAMISGGFASSIEFRSQMVHEGQPLNWHGEYAYVTDPENFPHGGADPVLTLGYQTEDSEELRDKTVVTVHNPHQTILEQLRELPYYFLPTNPQYQFYRYNHSKEVSTQNNLFTVYADLPLELHDHETIFAEEELQAFNFPAEQPREPHRVEILPGSIATKDPSTNKLTDRIFVDGLSVSSYYNCALQWSFWGFSNAEYGYKAKRSYDSGDFEGSPESLMALALGKCTNAEVFETIFENSIYDKKCSEGLLPEHILIKSLGSQKEAQAALKTAWQHISEKREYTLNTYITDNRYFYDQATNKNIRCVLLNSKTFVAALETLNIAQVLEKQVDLLPESKGTGEKIIRPKSDQINLFEIKNKLFETMLLHGGSLRMDERKGTLQLYLDLDTLPFPKDTYSFYSLPKSFQAVCDEFADRFGGFFSVNMLFDTGNKNEAIEINRRGKDYGNEKIAIESSQREMPTSGNKMCTVTFGYADPRYMGEFDESGLKMILEELHREFLKVSKDGKTIDEELFAQSRDDLGVLDKTLALRKLQLQKEEAEMVRRINNELSQERARLTRLNAEIADRLRLLGYIEEDAELDSPTREGLIPGFETLDLLTALEIQRTFISLFAPSVSINARNRILDLSPGTKPSALFGDEKLDSTKVAKYVEEQLNALENPDISLMRPELLLDRFRDTLICGVIAHSAEELPYQRLEISAKRTIDRPGISFNKKITKGEHALPCFPNCRVVGFYHPDSRIENSLTFKYCADRGVYTFESPYNIPNGLEVYYEYQPDAKITGEPTEDNRHPLADTSRLTPQWQSLIMAVEGKGTELTEKQRLDIALTAWLHAFDYDKNLKIDDKFRDLFQKDRYTQMINSTTGNCSYCADGFAALCRSIGLPTINLTGYLGRNGRYFPGPQNHGLVGVWINNEWVIVEPQLDYLTMRYKREEIPEEFQKIIQTIPAGRNIFPQMEQATTGLTVDTMVAKIQKSGLVFDPETIQRLQRIEQIYARDAQVMKTGELEAPPEDVPIPGVVLRRDSTDEHLRIAGVLEQIRLGQELFGSADPNATMRFVRSVIDEARQRGIRIRDDTTFDEILGQLKQDIARQLETDLEGRMEIERRSHNQEFQRLSEDMEFERRELNRRLQELRRGTDILERTLAMERHQTKTLTTKTRQKLRRSIYASFITASMGLLLTASLVQPLIAPELPIPNPLNNPSINPRFLFLMASSIFTGTLVQAANSLRYAQIMLQLEQMAQKH